MKSARISFIVLAIILLIGLGVLVNKSQLITPKTQTEYLRLHIRADSNESQAQAVKYKVKDSVVEFLTPIVSQITTKAQAKEVLNKNLTLIKQVVDKTLKQNGFNYTSTVKLQSEHFPLRTYGEFTLESGIYDALIIELGCGEGNNWWCVVYPPLCFTGSGVHYTYKSKIYEIIQNFKQRLK